MLSENIGNAANQKCRFGAPFMPIRYTVIFVPMPVDDPRRNTLANFYIRLWKALAENLDVLEGLEYSDNPGSYAGGSLTTGRVFHAGQVLVGSSRSQKKDHVPGLGRGPGSINNLRSPNSLKIIQFNINGISSSATRIKLDQVLELALTEGAQIVVLQETKRKTFTSLKIRDTISLG
ncbi:hypothetical protein TNCV_1303731 [Trichonephila clavipes]|nr:hypothetical protein TNCV_1303731 [Trichonephila clavipes]